MPTESIMERAALFVFNVAADMESFDLLCKRARKSEVTWRVSSDALRHVVCRAR